MQSESSISQGRFPRQGNQIRIQNAEESDESQIQENRHEDDVSSIEITEDGLSTNILRLKVDDGNSTQASAREMFKVIKPEEINCGTSVFSLDLGSHIEIINFEADQEEHCKISQLLGPLEPVEETEEEKQE
jgi:hypothetical protein